MENSFPVDEIRPDSMWNNDELQSLLPQQQPPVNGGDSGAVDAACEEVAALEGSPSDWNFEMYLEDQLMNTATPAVDSSNGPAGLVGVGPVLVAPVEPQEPAAVTAGGTAEDPVGHNPINMGKEYGTQHPEISQGVNADNGGIILESGTPHPELSQAKNAAGNGGIILESRTQHPEISQGKNAAGNEGIILESGTQHPEISHGKNDVGNGGIILESGTPHPEISQAKNAENGGIILESGTQHPEISQDKNAGKGGSKAPTKNKSSKGKGRPVKKASDAANLPARSSSTEPSLSDDDNEERAYKRKKSNRESARRSRSKKATHMKDLEVQVTHLRVENSLLMRRLDALNQQYTASVVNNRVLKADMETLRTKVKVAEDAVSRVIGIAPSQLPNHIVNETWPSFGGMPFLGSPSQAAFPDPSAVQVPVIQQGSYYTAAPDAATMVGNGSYMPVMATPPPLQAEGVAVNGSSNTMMTREAIGHIEKRMMSDDTGMPGSSGGGAVPPPGGLHAVADANLGGRY